MIVHAQVSPNAARSTRLEAIAGSQRGAEIGVGPADAAVSRACIFKKCAGTMHHIACANVPGTGAIARMLDGSVRTVGTTRTAWVCDQNVHHVQVTGASNSEVAHSRV
ncbi:MAG: hypothetical protein ABIX28_14130 [Vicinamibacterales bacterium]